MVVSKEVLWTVEQYEDYIQSVIRFMLPKYNKKNIRPSYQTVGGYTAKNIINQQYEDGISGFSEKDDFIYFKVKFKPEKESFINTDTEDVTIQRYITVDFSVYGHNSAIMAATIVALFRTSAVLANLDRNGFYLFESTQPEEAKEPINGTWWERHDFTVTLNESIYIQNPNKADIAESAVVEVKPV